MRIQSVLDNLSNLLAQDYCYFCGGIEEIICNNCILINLKLAKINYIQNVPVLTLTKKDQTFSKLITSYKDKGVSNLKIPFSKIIAVGLKHFSRHENVKVVNVPSTPNSTQKRGLDPIGIMTKLACQLAGKRFIYERNLLLNNQPRKDQSNLDYSQRKINMQFAFKANFAEIKPVIIVDDLITTGTTITESIRALHSQNIQVRGCVILTANS